MFGRLKKMLSVFGTIASNLERQTWRARGYYLNNLFSDCFLENHPNWSLRETRDFKMLVFQLLDSCHTWKMLKNTARKYETTTRSERCEQTKVFGKNILAQKCTNQHAMSIESIRNLPLATVPCKPACVFPLSRQVTRKQIEIGHEKVQWLSAKANAGFAFLP